MPSGSLDQPAGRMDVYVENSKTGGHDYACQRNRTAQVTNACKTYGGFYLGSIGGPAAILAQDNILKVEIVDFEELGMEAVRKITIKDFLLLLLRMIKE
jgi:fumarate hydratase class I